MGEPKKRNRLVTVCISCYRKKIKCDKQNPCANCIKSNIECQYTTKKVTAKPRVAKPKNPAKLMNPVWEERISKLAKVYIYTKPSRIFTRSCVINSFPRNNTLTTKCILEMRMPFNDDREIWKKKYMSYQPLMSSEDLISDNDIADAIEQKICPNYDAILERIEYFNSKLNSLLFNEAIPMDLLNGIFTHYFTKDATGKVTFIRPQKAFEYQPISLVLLVVDLVALFTRVDTSKLFKFSLTLHSKLFSELAIRMLNYSRFTKKQTIFGILSLICTFFTLLTYGDVRSMGFDYMNIYPLFQTCYNVAISIGLHLNPDEINTICFNQKKLAPGSPPFFTELPKVNRKRLWNMILMLDTEFCLSGFLPLVNFKFCHGYYVEELHGMAYFTECSDIIRDIPKIIYNLKGASLNEILDLESRISTMTRKLISLQDIVTIEADPQAWLKVRLKLRLIMFQTTLICSIRELIEEFQNTRSEFSNELDEWKERIESKAKLNFLYLLKFWQSINSQVQSFPFMIFMRQELWHCVGLSTIDYVQSLFDILSTQGSELVLNSAHEKGEIDVSITTIEHSLYSGEGFEELDRLTQPSYLLHQLDLVFKGSFKLTPQNTNLNYSCFLIAKMCSAFVVLLKVCASLLSTKEFTISDLELRVGKIVAMTNKKLSKDLNYDATTGTNMPVGINPDVMGDWSAEEELFHYDDDKAADAGRRLDSQMEQTLDNVLEDGNLNQIWSELNDFMNEPFNLLDYNFPLDL